MSYFIKNKVMLPNKKQSYKQISTKINQADRDVDYSSAIKSKLEPVAEKKGSGLSSLSQKLTSLKVNDSTPNPSFEALPNTRKRNIAFVL